MSYKSVAISYGLNPPETTPKTEDVYELWVSLCDAISQDNELFSSWRYNSLDGLIDIHLKDKVIADQVMIDRKRRIGGVDDGLAGFEAIGNFKLEEEFGSYRCTASILWGAPIEGSFVLETTRLKNTPMDKYWQVFSDCLRHLAAVKTPSFASIAPDASIDLRVFPHRETVGWMALVPGADLSEEMPFVALAEYIPEVGTLIVTTKEAFDAENPEHLKLQRATEIFLADRDLLPFTGI